MIDNELEELFKIPIEYSAFIGKRYYSSLQIYKKKESTFNQAEWDIRTNDLLDNYWLKYHRADLNELNQVLSELSGIPMQNIPKNLIYNKYIPDKESQKKTHMYHSRAVTDDPNYKYYYEVIFDPFFQKIRNALLSIDPLFAHISEEFLRHAVVGVLDDYTRGLPIVTAKYNGLTPPFYEIILYYGFNTINMNRFMKFCEINNDEYQTIFSHLYLNYKNKVA